MERTAAPKPCRHLGAAVGIISHQELQNITALFDGLLLNIDHGHSSFLPIIFTYTDSSLRKIPKNPNSHSLVIATHYGSACHFFVIRSAAFPPVIASRSCSMTGPTRAGVLLCPCASKNGGTPSRQAHH